MCSHNMILFWCQTSWSWLRVIGSAHDTLLRIRNVVIGVRVMQQHAFMFHPLLWIFHLLSQFSSCRQTVLIHHDFTLKPFCAHTFAPRNVIWGVVFTHPVGYSKPSSVVNDPSATNEFVRFWLSILFFDYVHIWTPAVIPASCSRAPSDIHSSFHETWSKHSYSFLWHQSKHPPVARSECSMCSIVHFLHLYHNCLCGTDNRHRLAIDDSLPFGFENCVRSSAEMFHETSSTFVRLVLMTNRQLIHGSAQGFFSEPIHKKCTEIWRGWKRRWERETNEECEKIVEEKSNTRRHDTWMVNRRVRHHYLKMWRVRAFWSLHTLVGCDKLMLWTILPQQITKNELQYFFTCWHGVLHNDNSKWMKKIHGTSEFNCEMLSNNFVKM